jgi:hypothetical protein
MRIFEAIRKDNLEGSCNTVVTSWSVSECDICSFCYEHSNQPLEIISKCDYYDHIDEYGLHCNRPNSLYFIKDN